MRNYLTFDNKDSRDFGVYINGQGTFRAPARSYNVLNIPGRNGDLLGFCSKLENVEITYRAFIYTNFDANIAALRSFLLSHVGYFKLTDSYHPDEYRLAYYKGPFVPDVVANNGAGSFDLTFVCKPQRFLNSGEEVTTLTPAGAEQHTYQGEIVNFSTLAGDKITSALADFHPIQDLHGYSNPWPAGGGKNLLFAGAVNETRSGITFTAIGDGSSFIVSGTAEGNVALTISTGAKAQNKLQSGVTYTLSGGHWANTGVAYIQLVYKGDTTGNTISIVSANGATTITPSEDATLTGIYINFISGNTFADDLVQPQFEVGSIATAFSSYSNICPISGRTGLSVYRTGVNVWDEQYFVSSSRVQSNYIPVLPNTTYNRVSPNNIIPLYYDADKTQLSTGTWGTGVFTTPADCYYLRFQVDPAYGETYNHDISINYPSTDTSYHAYQGNTYSVDWTTEAGTVYGGTLDVVTGVLTVDRASVLFDGSSDETWGWHNSGVAYGAVSGGIITDATTQYDALTLCDKLQPSSWAGRGGKDNSCGMFYGASYVFIKNTNSITSVATARTWLAANPITVMYPLATPLTYQLTAQEVEALADNYMWSDVGQVTVTVTDAMTIENPTLFDAKPLLRVYGAGTLTLGGQTITISTAEVYTDIDCEMMDCFKDTVSKNGNVSFSGYDFPVIPPGRNVITMDGVTQVDITPRWWAA